ncbi:hypothetical protein JZ751_024815 [Albula glossodonta]|uniref:Uncharacterized protein n=1 Tax=Albula glossodonta TaxID=121402 RepID=A0A8T2PGR9_9TELE|nr:hypothetical protein JZ751_024815 [Albula glossodonta]
MTEKPNANVAKKPIFIFFVCVMIAAVNSHYFGAMTAETMADMHRIERFCSVDKSILLSTSMEAYDKLCESHSEYKRLGCQLWWYHWLSSLCNLCCIICNGFSVFYMTQDLHILGL